MEHTADDWFSEGFSDSVVTPVKGSKAAVVISTPSKTHAVKDGASNHLPTGEDESDCGQDPGAQLSALLGPQLRGQRTLTPKRDANRHNVYNEPDPQDTSLDPAYPAGPSQRTLVSTISSDMDSTSNNDGEPEESESPSRNRRYINPRSLISGGVSGNSPVSPSQLVTPKGSKLSKERAAQRRSKKSVRKSPVSATVISSNHSTRSRAKTENLATTQEKREVVGEETMACKESGRLEEHPALRERVVRAGKASARKPGKRLGEQEEVEEDEDIIVSRGKRRRTRCFGGLSSSDKGENGQEGEGETEDEHQDDGRSAEVLRANPSRGPRTRNRGGTVKPRMTRKQKLLEELKSRRAGLSSAKDAALSSSSETLETKRGIYDTETENESKFPDDELDGESGIEAVRKSLRVGRNTEYDTDFVVSDDEGDIGAPLYGPGRLDIPIEFTHRAHKKLKEHFSDAIEWMVHNKLNPAFDRKDPVYRVAFLRLNSEAAVYSSSKFESSIWTQDFKRSVKARPEFYKESIISEDRDCEACNRKKHTATYKVQFGGKPYHHESLEDFSFSGDDDGDGDDDDSENDYDSRGNALPDPETIYYVGRICCLNAETAHALTHWRYHLNEWVVDELHRRKLFDPDAILKRELWNTKRRHAYCNGIMRQLQESGEVARLYQDFKENLNKASIAKPNQWGTK